MYKDFLNSIQKQFQYYKLLGEKTFAQLTDEQLFHQLNEESNSIAIIVKHLWGNMLSRWTDFLNSDGEKEWRNRDAEFENTFKSREEILKHWEEGWQCLFHALDSLSERDMDKVIYIRNQGHSVSEAILRQLAHYSYHVGQMVYIGKIYANKNWQSLSIPKGHSNNYNAEKFSQEKQKSHFTDEFLNQSNK